MTVAVVVGVDVFASTAISFGDSLFLLICWATEAWEWVTDAARRLWHRALRTRSDRSEFNVAVITLLSGLWLYPADAPMRGGRDVFADAIGKLCSLQTYAVTIIAISLAMHLGMLVRSYTLRCAATWLAGIAWTFTAVLLLRAEWLSLIAIFIAFTAWVAESVHLKIREGDAP